MDNRQNLFSVIEADDHKVVVKGQSGQKRLADDTNSERRQNMRVVVVLIGAEEVATFF